MVREPSQGMWATKIRMPSKRTMTMARSFEHTSGCGCIRVFPGTLFRVDFKGKHFAHSQTFEATHLSHRQYDLEGKGRPEGLRQMLGRNLWRSHFGVNEHPCATHFDHVSLNDTCCNHLKHGFFRQNQGTPPFTRQCSGV